MNIIYSFPNSILSVVVVLVVVGGVMMAGLYVRPRLTRKSETIDAKSLRELPDKVQ
jgi:hypothetical protein